MNSWSSSHHMYTEKRCNGNPISTKRSTLDGVGPLITDPLPTRMDTIVMETLDRFLTNLDSKCVIAHVYYMVKAEIPP